MNRRPAPLLLLFGLAFRLSSPAQGEAASPTMVKLPNDLRVIVKPDKSSRIAAVSAFVRFGAEHETRGTAGLRQFVQTTMMRGTRDRDTKQIAEELAARGASFNMAVNDDFVEFYATGGIKSWEYLLELVAETLTRPRLDDKEMEAVRTELLRHAQRREDQPPAWTYEMFRAAMYSTPQGEPMVYGLSSLGYDDSLRQLSRQSVRDSFRRYYVPNNTVLSVVGDVAVEEVIGRVRELFKSSAKRALPRTAEPKFPLPATPLAVKEREVQMTWLVYGFPAPAITSSDHAAVRVANAILGEGMGSRLFKSLREEKKLAYDLANFCPARAVRGDIATYVAIEPVRDQHGRVADLRMEETREAIAAEYERLKRDPVPEKELRRARNFVYGTFAMAHERSRQKAWQLGRFECLGVGYEYDRTFPESVKGVTAADIQRVANEYFTEAVVAVVMPKAMG